MLSARAYSFRQKSRLAISLSWIGGYTNVVALLICANVVSHVTGNTTNIGKSFAEGEYHAAFFFGGLWLSFLCGAVTSGSMTELARRAGVASKYVIPMAVEALLLSILGLVSGRVYPFVPAHNALTFALAALAAFAMGLQNATITHISGAVVRTTHLTGVTTDLGLEGVQFLFWMRDRLQVRTWSRAGRVLKISQRHPSFLRVLLLASIFGSFLFGATAGAYLFTKLHTTAMVCPVVFLLWIIALDWVKPIADVREIDLLSDPELHVMGVVKSLLPPELGIWRVACKQHRAWHRAPDFQQWVEKIPHHWRVVILALSPLTRLDSNALTDLEGAVRKLRVEGRRLVLAGINPSQYRALSDSGVCEAIDAENLCPDLEFAIARGIDLVNELHTSRSLLSAPSTSAA